MKAHPALVGAFVLGGVLLFAVGLFLIGNRRMLLGEALKTLNERERHILIERRLKDEPTTLEELSQQYNISRERVRQIEVRAFEKLQKSMKSQIVERRLGVG